MSTTTKRKLPEWMQMYENCDKENASACDSKKPKPSVEQEESDDDDVYSETGGSYTKTCGSYTETGGSYTETGGSYTEKNGKGVRLLLAKARLAMSLLAEEEENEKNWEQEKIATDGNDSFVALFDLEQCSLMDCMEVEDVLEIITKIKGRNYTSNYPYMYDREALIFDIDECFVKYCNMHGVRVQY
jgi:hypothetical protein